MRFAIKFNPVTDKIGFMLRYKYISADPGGIVQEIEMSHCSLCLGKLDLL